MYQFDDAETTALEVIDATLAGEAVEPEHAALAELTLILAGQRPEPDPTFVAALDDRVARRFVRPARPAPAAPGRIRRRWLYGPVAAVGIAAAVAVAFVGSNGGGSGFVTSTAASASKPVARALSGPATKHAASTGSGSFAPSSANGSGATASSASGSGVPGSSASGSGASAPASPGVAGTASAPGAAPTPSTTRRQVVQSAQLALSARPNQIDSVAQQVFNVIAAQNGVVKSSQVTATNNANGYAQFQLSVPTSSLSQTMAALSRLHGASVVSRTDSTQDITAQVGGAGMKLAEARALRTALLKQLANATTTTQIDSLKVQIRDADASISSDKATLAALHRQVQFSSISVTVNASVMPTPLARGSGSFTLGKAVHLAGRVLVVAAGVALVALAVMIPLGLAAAVVLWVAHAVRRRRREQALDLV
jgi:hypothetical protein